MKIEIGACEARTRLPELLRQVKAGKRFTITNRGAVNIKEFIEKGRA
jgi:prevent-host-death family protein